MTTTDLPRQCRRAKHHGGKPKRAYRTAVDALVDAAPGQEAYHCQHCGNYHIGRPPRPKVTSASRSRVNKLIRRLREARRA